MSQSNVKCDKFYKRLKLISYSPTVACTLNSPSGTGAYANRKCKISAIVRPRSFNNTGGTPMQLIQVLFSGAGNFLRAKVTIWRTVHDYSRPLLLSILPLLYTGILMMILIIIIAVITIIIVIKIIIITIIIVVVIVISQQPITWSVHFTAFSRTDLFLDAFYSTFYGAIGRSRSFHERIINLSFDDWFVEPERYS